MLHIRDPHGLLGTLLARLESEGLRPLSCSAQEVFAARLRRVFARMVADFVALYGEREDCLASLYALVATLAEQARLRPAPLAALDLERESSPRWFLDQRLVATMLYVDRYCDNLAGLARRLPYLKELGVNLVHLMPLFRSPAGHNDGGYAVSDYRAVDRRLGTMADLEEVARLLHREEMLLGLDLVLNHTADDHEWARRALAGEREFQERYFMYENREIPDALERHLVQVFPEAAPGNFTYRSEIGRWVLTVFHHNQWDLNYQNPMVLNEMVRVMLSLANVGVDVLRLDAVSFLWKRLGTRCQNLPEVHTVLRLLKASCRVVAPAVVFCCEAIGDPVQIPKYLGRGRDLDGCGCGGGGEHEVDDGGGTGECDLAYNAPLAAYLWDALATKSTRLLRVGLRNMQHALPEGASWISYVRDHDDIGLCFADGDIQGVGFDPYLHRRFLVDYYAGEFPGSLARGARFGVDPHTGDARIVGTCASLCGLEAALATGNPETIDQAVRKIVLLYAVVFAIRGIPLIYYGDEIGCLNDPSYRDHPAHARDSRWMNRPVMDWTKAAKVTEPGTVEHRLYAALAKLARLRRESPQCSGACGYQLIECDNPGLVAFVRAHDDSVGDTRGDRSVFVANFSEATQCFPAALLYAAGLPATPRDQYSERVVSLASGALPVAPHEFFWLAPAARAAVHRS